MLRRKIRSVIYNHLAGKNTKIMVIDGARQIGKSYIIRDVAQELFPNYIEIDFVEDKAGDKIFENATTTEEFYFRLSTITMVTETPEVQDLARLMKVKPADVVEVLEMFQICDPYLNREEKVSSPLLQSCRQLWQRYGNIATEQLAAYAEELKAYFKS